MKNLLFILIIQTGIVTANTNIDSLNLAIQSTKDTSQLKTYLNLSKALYSASMIDSSIVVAQSGLEAGLTMLKNDKGPTPNSKLVELTVTLCYTAGSLLYRYSRIKESSAYMKQCIEISKPNNYQKGLAKANNVLGAIQEYLGNQDSALYYYQKSETIASEMKDTSLILMYINNQASVYRRLQKFDQSKEMYLQSIEISKKGNLPLTEADGYKGLGNISYYQGDYPTALEYYAKAIKMFEELDGQRALANILSNSALVYKEMGEYEAALKFNRKVMRMSINQQRPKSIADDHISIGVIHNELGNLDSAAWYYNKALKLHSEINNKPGVAMVLSNLSSLYDTEDSLATALDYGLRSLEMYQEIGDQWSEAFTQTKVGHIYFRLGNISMASSHLEKSYSLSKQLGIKKSTENSARVYSEVLKESGNYKRALLLLEEADHIKDSLVTEENKKQVLRHQMQYEYDKKSLLDSLQSVERELELEIQYQAAFAQQKRKENLLWFLGILVSIISIGIYSRMRYVQKSKKIIQAEKERSDDLLLNILPSETAKELKEYGFAKAKRFDEVTILFSDIKGFTKLSEELSAEELVRDLDIYFRAFDKIVTDYGLEKIKTIGDAYIAVGGMPDGNSIGAKEVILAAQEMLRMVNHQRAEREAENRSFFEIRIGIHTGPVVAGIVGIKKFQYDIWGDTVNIAARMEQNSEPGKINISDNTYQIIKNDFEVDTRGKLHVKGKGEIEMYFVNSPTNNQPS